MPSFRNAERFLLNRWVFIALGLLTLVRGSAAWQQAHVSEPISPERLRAGEWLPDLPLQRTEADGPPVPAREIGGEGCRIIILFDPDCPGCNRSAESWRGKTSLLVGDSLLEVRWISTDQDPRNAGPFVRKYQLSQEAFSFPADVDQRNEYLVAFGVNLVPRSYVVTGDGLITAVDVAYYPADLPEGICDSDRCRVKFFL